MENPYKNAGVDIEAGYDAVALMKPHVERTAGPGIVGSLGGFGGLFDLTVAGIREPVLVSGADGVGTKLMLAAELGKHDTVGIDAVAMCVNDVVAQGARPLFFLDYIACGKVVPEKIEKIIAGVAEGCVRAGCALTGGETAEMPDMYGPNEYDLAGFAVGAVEKQQIITGERAAPGDTLIGLASSGVHSNGFSLIRRIIRDSTLSLQKTYGDFTRPLGEELLTPTRIYVKSLLALLAETDVTAVAHITGGGFFENIPRMLPPGLGVEIRMGAWPIPPVFRFLQSHGKINDDEIYNIFNMGIGMTITVREKDVGKTFEILKGHGVEPYVMGRVAEGKGVVLQ